MDILDKHSLKYYNLVIDKTSIHKPVKITEEVNKRRYRIVYLSLYSSSSNPIEVSWVKVKTLVRRSLMIDRNNLVVRIRETAKK
jgi:transposase